MYMEIEEFYTKIGEAIFVMRNVARKDLMIHGTSILSVTDRKIELLDPNKFQVKKKK